jgi:hypothetical protein
MSARPNADLPAVTTRTRRMPQPARGLAGAGQSAPPAGTAYWPADSGRDLAVVRSRIADRLVETVELSPAHLPPGVAPDLGGMNVSVSGAGLTAAPLELKAVFAGVAWLCMHRGIEWEKNAAESKPTLLYEIQPRA